jgi:endonuclease G
MIGSMRTTWCRAGCGRIWRLNRKHREVQIPGQFWKILVMVRQDGGVSATGYLVQQDDLIGAITERGIAFQFQQFYTYQVPITTIEALTGMEFGLNAYDPLQHLRSVAEPKAIEDYADVVF